MAPRKSTKTTEKLEEKGPKAIAKTRGRKPASAKIDEEAKLSTEPGTTVEEPRPAARRGRKPKALAVEAVHAAEAPAQPPAQAAEQESKAPIALSQQVQTVLKAIDEGRAVEFIFIDADANPPRTFEPRQLIFDVFTKAWFVWGWDRRYNAERHHRVDLLSEVNLVDGVGRAAQGPFKDGTPANQIGGWLGGEPIPVKAVLLKQWIYAVKQAPSLFPDFKLEDLEEGKAQVSFVGTDLRAIARWCMQFGDGIQVLEPQRLIDRIKQVGVTWAGKPVQTPAPPQPKPLPEPRQEHRSDHHRKSEHPRHEAADHHEPREPRENREPETPKARPAKIEIRIDRL